MTNQQPPVNQPDTYKRHKSKPLTTEQKAAIKQAYTATTNKLTMPQLAARYGVSISVIFRAVHS